MADPVTDCLFAQPDQQALCLAVERAQAAEDAAVAAQKAAEAARAAAEAVPEWSKLATGWIEALGAWVPWLVIGFLLIRLWPQIMTFFDRGGSFSVGELKLQVNELKSEATASVTDLSIDLMDASAVLITALDWKIGDRFKPGFDAEGDAIVETQKSTTQTGFFSLNLPPSIRARRQRKLHLLYMDDQEKLAEYKVGALRRRGYSVSYVRSLADAEKALTRVEFDAVITDTTHGDIQDAWRPVHSIVRRGDGKNARDAKALTPFVVQTSPEKSRDLMTTEPELRDDPRAFATASFMLIRHRLLWLETNEVDKP